jgi:hypothetical protein
MTLTLEIPDKYMKTMSEMFNTESIADIQDIINDEINNILWNKIRDRHNLDVTYEQYLNVLNSVHDSEPEDYDKL